MLEVADLDASSRRRRSCANVSLDASQGRDGRSHRPQRRRQDHAHALDHGAPQAGRRRDRHRRRRRDRMCRGTGGPARQSATCPRTGVSSPSSRSRRTCWYRPGRRAPDAPARLARIYELMPEVARLRASGARCSSRAASRSWSRFARALMSGKHLLLLDEPFEGVAPALARRLAEVFARAEGRGAVGAALGVRLHALG